MVDFKKFLGIDKPVAKVPVQGKVAVKQPIPTKAAVPTQAVKPKVPGKPQPIPQDLTQATSKKKLGFFVLLFIPFLKASKKQLPFVTVFSIE